jgi:hypothetical protein
MIGLWSIRMMDSGAGSGVDLTSSAGKMTELTANFGDGGLGGVSWV